MSNDERTVWCGNISDKVTEELLFELFLQAAPLERVRIPTDKEGRKSNFAFVTFKHEKSVDYAVQLLNGITLCDRRLNIKPRSGSQSAQRNMESLQMNLNQIPTMSNYNDLLRLGEMMQLNYTPHNSYNYDSWQSSREHPNSRDVRDPREDHGRKNDFKPYKHHERDDRYNSRNHSSQSHNQSRNYSDHRSRRHWR